jgi:hypothetical protein
VIRDSEDEYRESIVKVLLTKASGVFLWAFLAMKELKRRLLHRVKRTETLGLSVLTLPGNLDGIYSAILDRITHDNLHNHVLAALAWVCFGRRPLSVVELQHALSVDCPCGFSAHKAEISLWAASIDEDLLLSQFGGLVEVGEPGQQVQFIHQTVHDFLLKVTPWSLLPWNKLSKEDSRLPYSQRVHNWLAEACLMYIKLSYDAGKKWRQTQMVTR